jgi:peptidoglycan hydrolase-like protein with peptidoglycan-binding domain
MADLHQARQKCAEARKILQTARGMKGNRGLVIRAIELYQDVLRDQARALSEPFAALAQIAWAAGEPDTAFRFIQAGLDLHPRHSRLLELRKRMQAALKAPPPQEATPEASKPVSLENPTELVSDAGPEKDLTKISTGPEIFLLQRALRKLGYAVTLSGEYDRATYSAVRSFQSSRKIPVTGSVEASTREALNPVIHQLLAEEQTQADLLQILLNFAAELGRELNPELIRILSELSSHLLELAQRHFPPEDIPLPARAQDPHPRQLLSSRLGNMGQMGIVSKGWEVSRVQQVLAAQGYAVKINGTFDLQTFTEVNRFQMQNKLPINGLVEGATRDLINRQLAYDYLNLNVTEALDAVVQTLAERMGVDFQASQLQRLYLLEEFLLELIRQGHLIPPPEALNDLWQLRNDLGPPGRARVNSGSEVRLLQQVLAKLGFTCDLNGEYDQTTTNAVRSFQISRKLPLNGLLDARTREEINPQIIHLLFA